MRRELKEDFFKCFTEGHLSSLVKRVREDKDLDFQIRENYINIYYKGHSLLKLCDNFKIGSAFINNLDVPENLSNESNTKKFIDKIPMVKEEIRKWSVINRKENLEGEYEQLIIRANNLEKKTASEYYIIDRQYQTQEEKTINRFDLTGFYLSYKKSHAKMTVPLSFIEVKFSLNNDIQYLHDQLGRYYEYVKSNTDELVEEYQTVFAQKVELNLINQKEDKLIALSKVRFSKDINDFRFVVGLVDYNRRSELVKRAKKELKKLPFADQIRIFYLGFALWEQDAESLED